MKNFKILSSFLKCTIRCYYLWSPYSAIAYQSFFVLFNYNLVPIDQVFFIPPYPNLGNQYYSQLLWDQLFFTFHMWVRYVVLVFLCLAISFNTVISSSSHVIVNNRILFFTDDSIPYIHVYICSIFYIHSSVDRHLSCLLWIVLQSIWRYRYYFNILTLFFLWIYTQQ
jgi:hypothetical protein